MVRRRLCTRTSSTYEYTTARTGDVLFEECNTTGTLFEFPLVADVDNDSHADLIVIANNYSGIVCPKDNSKQRGLRVFGDNTGQWVRTRRIWNQHPYHVTNVEEDGTIPTHELPNWTQSRLNNFRQNVQPLGEFAAPDLVVQVLPPPCNTSYALYAKVLNIGQASVPRWGGSRLLRERSWCRWHATGHRGDVASTVSC